LDGPPPFSPGRGDDRLWTYKTRPGVLNFLLGWINALRWQRLPEMERLGDFLFRHLEGNAAYCDHHVRFGMVESINTTIKGPSTCTWDA
jgi:transposase